MTVSERLLNAYRVCVRRCANTTHQDVQHNCTMDNSQLYRKYLEIEPSFDKPFEIPLYSRGDFEFLISGTPTALMDKTKYCKYLIPGEYVNNMKTADAIIKEFFDTISMSSLLKVVTPTGYTYYGNSGIIFDSNFNPLLLMSYNIIYEDSRFKYKNLVINVHPNVFINNDIISKNIIKKLLPIFINKMVHIMAISTNSVLFVPIVSGSEPIYNVDIRVNDMSHLIKTQAPMSIAECDDNNFRRIIKENTDSILSWR